MHYSLLITSCQRFDLLKTTLDSFIARNCGGVKPRDTFIVEDSDAQIPEWLRENIHYYASHLGKITWQANECRMGQIYSADRLWSLCTQDYALWMEDDWSFNEGNFMAESFAILQSHPEVIMVSLRGHSGWHPLQKKGDLLIAEPNWRGGWGGFSFNCGVRRKSDYKRIGSYGRHVSYGTSGLGHEMTLSKMHGDMGYVIADLGREIVTHTGGSRSRAIEPLPPMPRILIAVPACRDFAYSKWESSDSPEYNAATAYNGKPYGTDIHISGPNPRIQAVRETWAKDIEAFKSHVDLRFFYGTPHPTDLQGDEVCLPVNGDYEHLPHKTVEICRWAAEQNYDYLFKADDDSYVWIDGLVQELMSNRFDYAGYTNANICSGGPGYWLSKRAMKEVARNGIQDHWAEDVTVGKIMSAANIYPVNLPNHRPGFSQHWFDIDNIPVGSVCIHALKPETMRELYRREHLAQ